MSEDAQDPPRTLPPLELDFAIPTREAWEAAAVSSNKDKPIDRLVTTTTEGLTIQPLYLSEDVAGLEATGTLPGRPPFVRGPSTTGYLIAPWLVAQELGYATAEMTNDALRHDLARGQTAVRLLLDQPGRAGLDPDDAAAQDVGRAGLSVSTRQRPESRVRGNRRDDRTGVAPHRPGGAAAAGPVAGGRR